MTFEPVRDGQDIEGAGGGKWVDQDACGNACEVIAEFVQEFPIVAALKTLDDSGD